MTIYKTIRDLIDNIDLLDPGEWIYTNIELWDNTPNSAEFYYIPWDYIQKLGDDQVYIDEDGLEMPTKVKNLNLRCWMLVSSLTYIAEKNKNLIEEINYYRDNDTFKT